MTAYAYQTSDDLTLAPAAEWPADSRLPRDAGRASLVVFLHPKCPCSRATLTELERLVTTPVGVVAPSPQVVVVAATPTSASVDWYASPLMARCRKLPATHVVMDPGGVETGRFDAATSGTVMYFDADGRRRYRGGITVARGHEGLSAGGAALARLMAGDSAPRASIPAFGCALITAPKRSHSLASRE
jgi:hypothetical protein